ncbi:MAG: putative glycoside hydrolase, partial [Treponema sp.]
IDIYGANGWYRTGARTGQEVELLADYVDIICLMFYPSHFRQSFLAYAPAKERPYRIYYWGSFRNKLIARNKLIIRPWAQAFYIPVSYDKKFYNEDYVQRQILGIKDSIDEGYVYWNNSGRYHDIRPDGAALPQ